MAGQVRRLPLVPPPTPGEAFVSWIDRLAEPYQITRRQMYQELGLATNQFAPNIGVTVTPQAQATITAATGIADVGDLLLARYHRRCLDLGTLNPKNSAPWSRTWWVSVMGSSACPHCLAEHGCWHTSWKTTWTFGCLRHGLLLSDGCPRCGSRWHANIQDERQHRICTSRLDGAPRRRRGQRRDACGYPASTAPAVPLGPADRQLLLHIAGLVEPGAGHNPGPGRFGDLIALCRLVANLATDTSVPKDSSMVVRDAHALHVRQRDDPSPRKGDQATSGYRSYRHTPNNPALAAAWLHIAWPLWTGDNAQDRITELIARAVETPGGTTRWGQLRKHWTPPAHLQSAVDKAHLKVTYKGASTLDGRSRYVRPRQRLADPNRVPQLLWPQAHARIATNVPAVECCHERPLRRFLSMALLRHIDPDMTTWGRAAAFLGLPTLYDSASHKIHRLITKADQHEALTAALDELAGHIDTATPDYAARRTALATIDPLPDALWAHITNTAKVGTGRGSRRWHDQARAWVWTAVTAGDFYLAPSLRLENLSGQEQRNEAQAYRTYFAKHPLPQLLTALRATARQLLDAHDLAGPLDYDPWMPT